MSKNYKREMDFEVNHWYCEKERTTNPCFALEPCLAIMQVNDMFDDLQANSKAKSGIVFIFKDGFKRLENQFLILFGDADPCIADFKQNVIWFARNADGDRPLVCKFDGVVDQIQ